MQVNVNGCATYLGKVVGDTLVCALGVSDRPLSLVCCEDDGTIVVVVDGKALERWHFGKPDHEVLCPRR